MKQIHELKIMHDRLMDIKNDLKTFEIRYNDRDYKVGDTLVLKSLEHYQEYETFVVVEIVYIDDFEQKENYLVLGIKKV